MKNLALFTIFLFVGVNADAAVWSLDSCINHAVEHSLQVRQRIIDVRQGNVEVSSAKSGYLPSLNAQVSQGWNIGRGLTSENTYADRNTSNTQWGVNLSVPLFDGLSTPRQVAYAKASLAASLQQLEAVKDDVTLNVIAAYLQVLYQKELHQEALHQEELSAYELTRRQALLDAGKIPEVDMLEAQSQLAQDRLSVATTENDTRMALVDLAQLLYINDDIEDFDIEPVEEALPTEPMAPLAELYTRAVGRSHNVSAARANITAAQRGIDAARTGYIPRLSFNAGIGSSYYTVSGFPNEPFGRQMRNNYSTSMGFSLSIPIFDGLQTRNQVNRAKVQKVNAELMLDQAEQELMRQVQQAYYQADGARRRLAAGEIARNAADKAFEAMQEKYSVGRATPTDYEQAKSKALTATTQAIQARYELILRTRVLDFLTDPSIR
ncbi:TolC family protein [uncultured Muribaculum sp.]|uniref:TolC family protein n=1 Tax=uncultured Muribaculum sp. TaxID=1918613 RepID=UPI0025F7CE86|nr:TolC family protein [uncultured Muribaculum sp.]